MWGWFRRRRRQKWQQLPFPDEWDTILEEDFADWPRLEQTSQEQIRRFVQVFFREKNWEGCGGQEMTDRLKVIISAQVGVMSVGYPELFYDHVLSILVYPDAYRAPNTISNGIGIVSNFGSARMGEAWWQGPVILSWKHALQGTRGENTENLICHEFAHQIDMINGRSVDGTPPLGGPEELDRWSSVMSAGYQELSARCRSREPSVIRCYGMTNPGEFFAVSSEAFFSAPHQLQGEYPAVFEVLKSFYRQDPTERHEM